MSTSHPPLLVPGDVLPGALIGAELDRIAASDAFRRSPRQARMLRHLVALSLGGDRAGLRELPLGVALFDRDPARFDPRQDSIVRVEARRLRHRLAAYYADEGQDARIEFLLPVGSYEVLARRREVPPPQQRRRASLALFDFVEDADRPAAPGSIAHALATELAALLTRLHGLRVVVGGALDGGAPARQAAAKALGVDALLIGRVLAAPPRIEIDLLRAADLESLWSGAQPLAAGTAAALWPLARRLIAELQRAAEGRARQRIGPAAMRWVGAPGAAPAAARQRDRLALARAALLRLSVAGCEQALALAQAVVEADSDCADAHALAAEAHVALAGLTSVPSRPELERARAAARRALELDADSAAAHGVLGQIALLVDHDWPHAEARLLAGLRCAPGVAASHARYGWALTLNGRHAEARAAYLEARDLDPLSLLYRAHEALIAIYERDWPLAATGLDDVLATAPEHLVARVLRAALHLYAGEIEAGRIGFEALDAAHPGLSIGACGIAQARALAGDTCGAEQLLTGLLERERAGWVSPYQIAMVLARMGRLEAAVEQLERAATAADFNFACVGVDPAFDDLRADAAGAALLRRHGFGHLVPARVLR